LIKTKEPDSFLSLALVFFIHILTRGATRDFFFLLFVTLYCVLLVAHVLQLTNTYIEGSSGDCVIESLPQDKRQLSAHLLLAKPEK